MFLLNFQFYQFWKQISRSLCAHLAAANTFTIDHILKPENQQLIHSASFYYIAGFFLTVCPEAILHVAKHAHESGKVGIFIFPFLIETRLIS